MFKKIYNRLFNKWTKWELIEERTTRYQVTRNPILGTVSTGNVLVNVYRKTNKYTGKVKTKYVSC